MSLKKEFKKKKLTSLPFFFIGYLSISVPSPKICKFALVEKSEFKSYYLYGCGENSFEFLDCVLVSVA